MIKSKGPRVHCPGGSNRSSLEQQAEEAYDIPHLGPKRPIGAFDSASVGLLKIATSGKASANNVYDTPPQVTRDMPAMSKPCLEAAEYVSLPATSISSGPNAFDLPMGREVPLELHSALEALIIHQQEVQAASQLLFAALASSGQGPMREGRESLRVPCHTLLNSVRSFFTFARGAVNSAQANAPDPKIPVKLERLVQTLAISYSVIADSCAALDKVNWQCPTKPGERDDLDRFVACARSLSDDVQQISSCVHGNATLIFRRTPAAQEIRQRPLPQTPQASRPTAVDATDGKDAEIDYSEYDYIQMQNDLPSLNRTASPAGSGDRQQDFGAHYDSLLKRSQVWICEDLLLGIRH